jgi:hypothetical protein
MEAAINITRDVMSGRCRELFTTGESEQNEENTANRGIDICLERYT